MLCRRRKFVGIVAADVKTQTSIPPPVKTYDYDTMKIEYKSHGAKTSDTVINTENDEKLMLKADLSLTDCGVENETEISLFKLEDYLLYRANPHTEW